jgi:hypothetical protein
VNASQIADRSIFDHQLGRIGVIAQARFNAQELLAPSFVFKVRLQQSKIRIRRHGQSADLPFPVMSGLPKLQIRAEL